MTGQAVSFLGPWFSVFVDTCSTRSVPGSAACASCWLTGLLLMRRYAVLSPLAVLRERRRNHSQLGASQMSAAPGAAYRTPATVTERPKRWRP